MIIKKVTVDGRAGFATFIDENMQPIQEASAAFLKIVFDDGGDQLILAAHPLPPLSANKS